MKNQGASRMIMWVSGIAILAVGVPTVALAQSHDCLVNDGAFATVPSGCKDLATRLVWSTEDCCPSFALNVARCEALEEGGFTDWRVPTLAELEAAYLNGAPTHFEYCCTGTNIEHWSDRKTGNWEWGFGLMTHGFANKHFTGTGLRSACVREAVSSCGDGTCDAGENSCICPEDCGEPPANETECTDGLDDDCDGLIDCVDNDCDTDPACDCPASETLCADGLDDDCDGDIDCDDADCAEDPACACLPVGAACLDDSECCSGKCKGGRWKECKP